MSLPDLAELDHAERAELDNAASALAALTARAIDPAGGFGYLDHTGRLIPERGVHTWITARMTHVAALAQLRGDPAMARVVDHGVDALRTRLRDEVHGGWHSRAGEPGGDKEAYAHAFVVLAAASALGAGHPDGSALLTEALTVFEERFWDETEGLVVDTWSSDWTRLDAYRGINATMHAVEALLAAAAVTGDSLWSARAERIVRRVVEEFARPHRWRLPEHFTCVWRPVLDYNINAPADPFRPYGVTIGHLLEWSRLAVNTGQAIGSDDLFGAAKELYAVGVSVGWAADGAPGFVYTVDWDDEPVVSQRMHWVLAEAMGAAWTLHRTAGEAAYLKDFRQWWAHAKEAFIAADGSWRHELDRDGREASTVWVGRPDTYHAYQAVVLPLLPSAPSLIGSARSAAGLRQDAQSLETNEAPRKSSS